MRSRQAPDYDPDADPDTVKDFASSPNVAPDVIYFHPWDYIPSVFGLNITNGLHIETSGISSTSVPMPIPEAPLPETNSQYVNSSIPVHMIKIPAQITRERPFEDFRFTNGTFENQVVRLSLFDAHINRYPRFDAQLAEPANAALATVGFHNLPHIG